ncbi:MAG: hypothetical protein ABIS50_04965 [Luteolibacter sp.]|uniref:hypothetical protein n=1 Tax=Luteolibacter sp. TaxID=1962973 RepID=UPI003265AD8C
MIPIKKSHTASLLVCAVLLLTYFAGYAKIRKDCQNFGGRFFVVPGYVATRPSLRTIYRPSFLLEQRFTGNQFSISLWGMISP